MDDRTASRFWGRVDKSGDCWLWLGALDIYGYGKFSTERRTRGAHRIAYIDAVGEPPEGLVLDHLCRNRACVNPAHLEAVTQRENVMRSDAPTSINAMKTHCHLGHEFDAENTYPMPNNGRACRECRREACRKWQAKRRAMARLA